MAEMVWCQSCKTVVWAYDHQPHMDIRGWLNLVYMSCPQCGEESNFDGWGSDNPKVITKMGEKGLAVFDWWSLMRYVAQQHKVKWAPSGNNRWFQGPVYDKPL